MDVRHRFEEVTLFLLIILNLLDFLKVLPPDIDFLKKIISWSLLGYIVYHISITKQLFGEKHNHVDIMLISVFFILVSNHLVSFSHEVLERAASMGKEEAVFTGMYNIIIINSNLISYWSFYLGMAIVILFSLYLTFFMHVHKPSLINTLHEHGIPKTIRKIVERFFVIFLLLCFFFLFVFSLMMEWLALAVDSSLVVFAVIFYFFTAFRRHFKSFDTDSFIYRVGNFGEDFYNNFIELMHTRKRVYLLLSGILVLHLLTDIGNFIVPYLFGISGFMYLPKFDAMHQAISDLFFANVIGLGFWDALVIFLWYILNIMGAILLLFLPSYIWYKVYKREGFKVQNSKISILFCSLLILALRPVFSFSKIDLGNRVGIDILTSSVQTEGIQMMLMIVLAFGVLIYLICFNHWMKERLIALSIILIDLFTAYYVYAFFIGNVGYYISSANSLIGRSYYFIPAILFIFLLITSIFYLLSFIVFVAETRKEFKYIK